MKKIIEFTKNIEQKFKAIEDDNGCWNYDGYKSKGGYGVYWNGRTGNLVHRISYENFIGPIPNGLVIDHLCRNRACINPKHLEPVSQSINCVRGDSASTRNRAKTHCQFGHEFNTINSRIKSKSRDCRICAKFRARAKRRGLSLKEYIIKGVL